MGVNFAAAAASERAELAFPHAFDGNEDTTVQHGVSFQMLRMLLK